MEDRRTESEKKKRHKLSPVRQFVLKFSISKSHPIFLLFHVEPVVDIRQIDRLLPQTLLDRFLLVKNDEPEVGDARSRLEGLALGGSLVADADFSHLAEARKEGLQFHFGAVVREIADEHLLGVGVVQRGSPGARSTDAPLILGTAVVKVLGSGASDAGGRSRVGAASGV